MSDADVSGLPPAAVVAVAVPAAAASVADCLAGDLIGRKVGCMDCVSIDESAPPAAADDWGIAADDCGSAAAGAPAPF